jgi:histidyl-tRNA synthetase
MFTNFGEKETNYCLPVISGIRKAGISVEIYPEAAKMKKQMSYADNKKIRFTAIVGENEIAENKITLKNMITGEQFLVTEEQLMNELKK